MPKQSLPHQLCVHPSEGTSFLMKSFVLTDIVGLSNLTKMNEELRLQHLDEINSFVEIYHLTSVDRALTIVQNGNLFGIHGVTNLTYVRRNSFRDDSGLHVIHGFANLVFMFWDFSMSCNYSLTSTSGFENLVSINACLVMCPGELPCHIDGLSSVPPAGDDLVIDFNKRLSKVIAFLSIGAVGTSETVGHQHLQNRHIFFQVVHPSMGETTTGTTRHPEVQGMFTREGKISAAMWGPSGMYPCVRDY